ncbi:hypothetical protein B9479_008154, partial [Cryptococcus floricola]
MTLVTPDTKHIVIVPAAMWGHIRPLLHLAINLLTLHPDLCVTFLITPSIAPRLQKDLEQSVADLTIGTTPVAERLQTIVCMPKGSDASKEFKHDDMGKEVVEFASVMPEIISGLYDANYNINGTLNKFEGLPPSLVLYDMFQTFVPDIMVSTLESLNITVPPLVMFCPCSPASVYHFFGPEEKGGSFARITRLAEQDIAKGADPIEAYAKYAFRGTGQVLSLPGLPPKFDCEHPLPNEWWPHKDTVPISGHAVSASMPALKAFLHKNTVAIAIAFAGELEPEAVSALEQEFSDKTIYTVGPQFPEEMWEGDFSVKAGSDDDKRVVAFLDQMKDKHGSNSVCYISFGSLFFPIFRPELIRYILKTLQETGVPFVFAYASGIVP